MYEPSRTPATPDQVYALIRLVRPVFRSLLAAVEGQLEETDVSVAMRGMLECLAESGPRTVPDLARRLIVPRQAALETANALMRLGYAEAIENAAHRRSRLVRLTEAGRATIGTILGREQAIIAPLSRRLTERDVSTAIDVLRAMIDHFGGTDPASRDEHGGTTP